MKTAQKTLKCKLKRTENRRENRIEYRHLLIDLFSVLSERIYGPLVHWWQSKVNQTRSPNCIKGCCSVLTHINEVFISCCATCKTVPVLLISHTYINHSISVLTGHLCVAVKQDTSSSTWKIKEKKIQLTRLVSYNALKHLYLFLVF